MTVNAYAGHSVLLDKIGIFFAVYLIYLLLLLLVVVAFKNRTSWGQRMFWEALSSAIIARYGIVEIIRFFYHHPRPFMVEQVKQLVAESGWSFPSGHITFLFALSMSIWFYNRKFGYALFVSSLLVGIARIYVGVHWPFDIVGGIIVGTLVAIIWHQIVGIYLKRKIQTRV